MRDVLMVAATLESPALRHELPVAVPDPVVYVERNGSRIVFASSMEIPRLRELGLELVALEELGTDELLDAGVGWHEFYDEVAVRACRRAGVDGVVVPPGFSLATADRLRAAGITVDADAALFAGRRRVKNGLELAGIRRAQRGAEAAMAAVRERLQAGAGVTCEELKAEVARACIDSGVLPPELAIVSHGAQTAIGHEGGSGMIRPGEPVIVDLFPQDPESGCFADMTRTFCVGQPPAELVELQALCLEALRRTVAAMAPGVSCAVVNDAASEVFEQAGYPTERRKPAGEILTEGFCHALGHGVGLEVHEPPLLARGQRDELVPGDVVAVEPGLYRSGFGGCRLEDLVLVTATGCEVLTSFPYDL